jgi:hypothetical protein
MAGREPLDMRGGRLPRCLSQSSADGLSNLFEFGVFAGFLLAVDQVAINDDLKGTTPRGDEANGFNLMLEFCEQTFDHAHGTVFVASSGAVLNRDVHGQHRNGEHLPTGTRRFATNAPS